MTKLFRLCNNFGDVKQFIKDVQKKTGIKFKCGFIRKMNQDWYPQYISTGRDKGCVSTLPLYDISEVYKRWYERNGFTEFPSMTRSKEDIVQLISEKTGFPVTKVKGNLYKVETKNGERHFRISVMEKDGGVDLKYRQWACDDDLVVEGGGAMKVRSRVDSFAGMFIYSAEEFINKIKD